MATLFNTHLISGDAAKLPATFATRLRDPGQRTAASVNDHALARRCAP